MSLFQSTTFAFLFTDIEGSTGLWEHLAEAMARALDRHDAIVRDAIESHGGKVFKTVGDGFCSVFGDARDAAEAAAAAQRALQAEPWQALDARIGSLRVRMAIHVGPAIERAGDLYGPTLNQTARLLGAGHGGQILTSLVAQQMIRGRLGDGLELVDHGHHSLRDLRYSEHIFEIVVAGLPRVQRPLRVADAEPRDNPLIVTSSDEPSADRDAMDAPTIIARLLHGIRGSDANGAALGLSQAEAHMLAHHVPHNLTAYRLTRLAEWSLPQYQLDRRFVSLSLLVDLGEESRGMRWLAEPQRFDDLADILDTTLHPAFVVLGAPGGGKSTLLRHLELTLNARALRDETDVVTWYVPLNQFRLSGEDPEPEAIERWFEARWRDRYPALPPLAEIRRQGRLVLLLDGLNEIPHKDAAEYRRLVIAWRHFVHVILGGRPGNRAVFSCRGLDYSAPLSSPTLRVPQVVIEALDSERIQEFLERYCPQHATQLWEVLRTTPQVESLCTPYLLRMLVDQVEMTGEIPRGRAALFTGFVRLALEREIMLVNPLLGPNELLTERDHRQIVQGGPWESPYALPVRGRLLEALSRLAFTIHARTSDVEASQVVVDLDTACRLIDSPDGPHILEAAEALGLLGEVTARDEVSFVHQLLQEYFAARQVAREPDVQLAWTEWRADSVAVPLRDAIDELAPADPLPLLPGSRWDEVMLMACPMAVDPDAFIRELLGVNLALAGRCAGAGEAVLTTETRTLVAQTLRRRRDDPTTDLRARIEVALRLGELGDPMFEPHRSPDGRFVLPPMITVPATMYTVGHDGQPPGEALPVQKIELPAFSLGCYPVTNAEYALFISAGGYEDDRWWVSDEAKAWHRGEGTGEPARQREWQFFTWFHSDSEVLQGFYRAGYVTQPFYERWQRWLTLDEPAFRTEMEEMYPDRPIRVPFRWEDDGLSAAFQPVIGVTYYEALAYCAWLAKCSGVPFRLPSEVEWEAAARGPEGRCYAWGDTFDINRCNAVETHVRRTTPVGAFPGGGTPEGILDLTGNVFEWTDTLFAAVDRHVQVEARRADLGHTTRSETSSQRRVIRGGSWGQDQNQLQTWRRIGELPAAYGDNQGFRLALPIQ